MCTSGVCHLGDVVLRGVSASSTWLVVLKACIEGSGLLSVSPELCQREAMVGVSPAIEEAIINALGKPECDAMDKPVRDYLWAFIEDRCAAEDKGSFEDTGKEVVRRMTPFLTSAQVIADESEAQSRLRTLWTSLVDLKLVVEGKRQTLKTLAKPVMLSRELYAQDKADADAKRQAIVDVNTNDDIEWETRGGARLMRMKTKKAEKFKKEKARKEQIQREAQAKRFVKIHRRPEQEVAVVAQRDIVCNTFDLSAGSNTLLRDTEMQLIFGRRYGLVGRNGMGKSTLLRALVARDIPGVSPLLQILHVEQEVSGDDRSALRSVLDTDVEREELLQEERRLLKLQEDFENRQGLSKNFRKSHHDNASDDSDASDAESPEEDSLDMVAARLNAIYKRMEDIDAYSAEARASTILAGLGFTTRMQNTATREFSGGWRMRVALAQALYISPDILLLDEPTNHLDIRAVLWLERFLMKWEKTVVLVSHDREFLNRVSTDIVHLQNLKLTQYRGDYDTFERVRMERVKNMKAARDAQQQYRAHVQKFIDRFRYKAKISSRVQSRIKTLQKMDIVPAVVEDPSLSFLFPSPTPVSGQLITCDDVTFGYTEDRILFRNIDLSLDMDSRVALVGRNGVGKSTLMNVMMEDLIPLDGRVQRNAKCRIARFHQHHVDSLNLTQNPVEYFMTRFPGCDPQMVRSHLGGFGINGPTALQSIDTLSGGQKSRVAFAYLTWQHPHLLLLDEPTNHLDLDTVEVLIQALNDYGGGLFIISHDEHFINAVCDEIWILEENQTITRFHGGFKEYKAAFQKEIDSEIK